MKAVRKKMNDGYLGEIDCVSPESTYIFDCAINLIGEKLASLQCFQEQEWKILLFGMKEWFLLFIYVSSVYYEYFQTKSVKFSAKVIAWQDSWRHAVFGWSRTLTCLVNFWVFSSLWIFHKWKKYDKIYKKLRSAYLDDEQLMEIQLLMWKFWYDARLLLKNLV